jgi:DNA-directed RNA polymerase subunit RPC12/RpoP
VNSAVVCLKCQSSVFNSTPPIGTEYQSAGIPHPGTTLNAVGMESSAERHARDAAARSAQQEQVLARAEERRTQAEAPLRCPKCSSAQLTAQKHGVSALKAAGGFLTLGPLGLLAGLHGSRKVDITCVKCGHSWKPVPS